MLSSTNSSRLDSWLVCHVYNSTSAIPTIYEDTARPRTTVGEEQLSVVYEGYLQRQHQQKTVNVIKTALRLMLHIEAKDENERAKQSPRA